MKYKDTRNMSIYLPESQLGEEKFEAVWVLKNTSSFDTYLSLKRQKMCDCPLLERTAGLTIRSLAYECRHRSLFSMSLSGNVFQVSAYLRQHIKLSTTPVSTIIWIGHYEPIGIGFILRVNTCITNGFSSVAWLCKKIATFLPKIESIFIPFRHFRSFT